MPVLQRRTFLAGLGAACALPAVHAAEPARLKFTSFEPPQARITAAVLASYAREASAASQGTLQIDMYAGGTLGRNPLQQLKLVTDGIADIGWVVLPYTPGRFDDTEVVGLPFGTANAAEASLALHRLYANGALVGFQDLKMLAVAATPPLSFHGNIPVRLPGDLKGKRVRVSGDHLVRVVEALGAAPVQVGGGAIAEALSRGVVDTTLNNWGFVGDFKVNEVASHHLNIPFGAVAVGVVMRQDRFDRLPPPARAALDKLGGEALARRIGDTFDQLEGEVRDRVARSGRNQVATASAADIAEWKRAVEPVNAAWSAAKPRNQRIAAAFQAELQRARGVKS